MEDYPCNSSRYGTCRAKLQVVTWNTICTKQIQHKNHVIIIVEGDDDKSKILKIATWETILNKDVW